MTTMLYNFICTLITRENKISAYNRKWAKVSHAYDACTNTNMPTPANKEFKMLYFSQK